MSRSETSPEVRIDRLLETLRSLSRASEPTTLMRRFGDGIRSIIPYDGVISISTRGLGRGEYKITRFLESMDDPAAAANPWRDWHQLPTHTGGLVGELMELGRPVIRRDLANLHDEAIGSGIRRFGSLLAVPVYFDGEARYWTLLLRRSSEGFTDHEVESLVVMTNVLGQATHNLVNARELAAARDRVEEQIHQVARIQRALLPERLPDIPGLELAGFYQPCEHAGGDYYDFTALDRKPDCDPDPTGRWGLIIADVSGHGASAAVVMAMMQSIVHAYPAYETVTADELLNHLNEQLIDKRLDSSFVTAFVASYDPKSRELEYACAGHYPPRLKKPGPGSPVVPLKVEAAVPLGITSDFDAVSSRVTLEPEDTLILYTDGIIESFNPSREMFGMEGLDRSVHECSGEPGCVIESITTALRTHEAGERPTDDQTIIALKVKA